MLEKLLDIHNNLSDKDFIWFPFQKLKPKPHEPITWPLIFIMTFCFSIYGIIFLNLRLFLFNNFNINNLLTDACYIFIGFLTWFRLVTSTLWNIRARRLAKSNGGSNA